MATLYPVILAGGAGGRLWPLSRQSDPKPLQALAGPLSLLQQMAARVTDRTRFGPLTVLAPADHRHVIAEQLRSVGVTAATLILEPVARDTAPALAVAAAWLSRQDADAVILVLPADLAIADPSALWDAVAAAQAAGAPDRFVRIPIVTDDAEAVPERQGGVLVLPVAALLDALEQGTPRLLDLARAALDGGRWDGTSVCLDPRAFAQLPAASIEDAILGLAQASDLSPMALPGRHIDTFGDLWSAARREPADNVSLGPTVCEDVEGCYLRSEGPLIAAAGLRDLVVVATTDVVLVTRRDAEPRETALLALVRASGAPAGTHSRRVHRPWGWYETMHSGPGFQVKTLCVAPGGRLSLQKHAHRAEHWVVVEGVADVHLDGRNRRLARDESIHIPQGSVHRLENRTDRNLMVVEVQTGDDLGEDDIVRLEDAYARP
jgi:mannose-1-phosphate guanylyltransferase/mannose-6-phosphate isomerase-like protein (cupin superfamily)